VTVTSNTTPVRKRDRSLGLFRLLDPEVLANPYPLYHRLRTEEPVYWDAMLHAWVVTRYADVVTVLQRCSAARTPDPEQLTGLGLESFAPIAQVMKRQMLFNDPPSHTRIRRLASTAFTPHRVDTLRQHIQEITDNLMAAVRGRGRINVIADLAAPLPATVTAELLGVPVSDWEQLKAWTSNYAEVLGNFQHNPDHTPRALKALEEMTAYFREKIHACPHSLNDGLITAFMSADDNGDKLSEEDVIANTILTMAGGQETTTNLIGNGLLTLLRNPDQLRMLQEDPSLIPTAIEELLRFESPIQYTARLAPEDMEIGGQQIRKRQAVMAVFGAANRDPERFTDPDHLDIHRENNRHLAFGWAAHFCFGAPLARMEGQIAFESLLRLPNLQLEPAPLAWQENHGFRGLKALHVTFDDTADMEPGNDRAGSSFAGASGGGSCP
jgi:pimeloyl-[acyl-carrier protein] synthase